MKNTYPQAVKSLPLGILRVAFTQSPSQCPWETHGVIANDFPGLVRYDFLDHHMFMLPVSSGSEAKAAKALMKQEITRFGGRMWKLPTQPSEVALHFHTKRHTTKDTQVLIEQEQLDEVIRMMVKLVGTAQVHDGRAYPLAEDGSSSITDGIVSVAFEKTTEFDLVELETLAMRLVVREHAFDLDRVLVTCGGRGIWIDKDLQQERWSEVLEDIHGKWVSA